MEHQHRKPLRVFNARNPVRWEPGERERLIEEALAQGKVQRLPRGASAYDRHTAAEIEGLVPRSRR